MNALCLQVRYRGYFLSIAIGCDRLQVTARRAEAHPIKIGCRNKVVDLKGQATIIFLLH